MPWIEPVTLEGEHVRLEPANLDRLDDVWDAGRHSDIWTFFPFTMQRRADMAFFIDYVNGSGVGFHTVDLVTGTIVGGTAFLAPNEERAVSCRDRPPRCHRGGHVSSPHAPARWHVARQRLLLGDPPGVVGGQGSAHESSRPLT